MSEETNKWRYRCPKGHAQWYSRSHGYYCSQCDDNGDDPYFDYLEEATAKPFHY